MLRPEIFPLSANSPWLEKKRFPNRLFFFFWFVLDGPSGLDTGYCIKQITDSFPRKQIHSSILYGNEVVSVNIFTLLGMAQVGSSSKYYLYDVMATSDSQEYRQL